MFDRNSDYALNKKDPDAIVCKSATGIHIRLTRMDFANDEEFLKWKSWSDEDYHSQEKAEHTCMNHTTPIEHLSEIILAVQSPDELLVGIQEKQEREQLLHQLAVALDQCLTPAQRRRLCLYYVDGLTIREIADKEGVKHQNISKRILAAKKILKNFLKRWVPNTDLHGDK